MPDEDFVVAHPSHLVVAAVSTCYFVTRHSASVIFLLGLASLFPAYYDTHKHCHQDEKSETRNIDGLTRIDKILFVK